MKRLCLLLEDGSTYIGNSFGADKLPSEALVGEVVFTTQMTGYLETLTDPSYHGQIVVQTFPLIGNYGVIPADFESDHIALTAYLIHENCTHPSNFRSEKTLSEFLRAHGIIGIEGIDTRSIVRHIRERGVMNGQILELTEIPSIERIKAYSVNNAVQAVTELTVKYTQTKEKKTKYHVAFFDFGYKNQMISELQKRGCEVTVYPANTKAETVLCDRPDGIFLSNGPGNPQDNTAIIETIKALIPANIPMLGICLGHQLMALAHGFSTKKLLYGHRGANQPVRDNATGHIYITSQNHGYAVLSNSIDNTVAWERFVNVNDKTCEGITYLHENAMSVQFHPEACSGPLDANFLFDEWVGRMEEYHAKK